MSPEAEVLAANAAFYSAFAARDERAMERIWARGAPVACIHPGWDVLRGREAVLTSFRAIMINPEAPTIRMARATAHLLGEAAFVLCEEHLPGARLVVTNIFVREEGAWRLVHHQSGPAPRRDEPSEDEPPPGPVN